MGWKLEGSANMLMLTRNHDVHELLKQYKQLIYDSEEKGYTISFEAMILNLITVAEV
jgi:hypothetical protein